MPGSFSIGGLASGLDTQGILQNLITLERRPVALLNNRVREFESRLDAWKQVTSRLQSLKSSVDEFRREIDFNLYSTTSDDDDAVSLTATSSAASSSHSIVVNTLAQARKIGSTSFTSKTDVLNLSGDFLINQNVISVSSTDSLISLVDKINNADADVTASILQVDTNDFRLVITDKNSGANYSDILDASTTDVLQSLGFFTSSVVAIKNAITGGAESDTFSDISSTVGGLLNLNSPQSGTVTINDKTVAIDFSNDSLSDIRDNINAAAPTGVTASIETTTENGTTVYKLKIDGTTTYIDANNILQTIGVLEGDSSAVKETVTGSVANDHKDTSQPITASVAFDKIKNAAVANADTITISGTDHAGLSVSGTFIITDKNTDTVQDLLTEIESVFGGNVTASVDSAGKIVVTDSVAGTSQLTLTLTENNEGGGSLDFGTFSSTTTGIAGGQAQAGQDASLVVDGITITRAENSISDILAGVTLNLKEADSAKTISVAVDRDYDAIVGKLEKFITNYNDMVDFIDEQFTYNEEEQTAGVLFGDVSLVSVQGGIQSIIIDRISGLPSSLRSLAQVGIDSDRDGKLTLDKDTFLEEIQSDFDGVVKVFAGVGQSSDGDISFISHTKDTKPGSYAVNITQAATQASVTGTIDLTSGISGSEVLTITDKATGQIASITIAAGADTDEIVSQINTELAQEYKQALRSSGTVLDGGSPATAFTLWTAVDDNVAVGDTITISGTTHDGKSVSGLYTVSSGDTIQDFLTEIQNIFDSTGTPTIDGNGKIVITSTDNGTSQLNISLTANNEGGGSLNFGTMDVSQTGRYSLPISASNSNGFLKLTQTDYGVNNGYTISQSQNNLGITDGEFLGQDVTGTINGESATGAGQFLTGDSGEANIDGLVVKVSLTPAQLTAQGQDQGTTALTKGIAEQLFNHIFNITDQFTGFVSGREETLQDTINDINDQIDVMEARVAHKISTLELRFVNLERAISQLSSLSSFLTSQLSILG
jgi:flagellar hook-associated protein 2